LKIAITNYGMGNIRSVINAFNAVGYNPIETNSPGVLADADAIVLPGVGAFGDGVKNLNELGLANTLREHVLEQKKPFLGICLGMHLLATEGREHGHFQGLDIIPGTVQKLSPTEGWEHLHIPHIGWNNTRILKPNGLYKGVKNDESFYYLHSYTFALKDPGMASGTCFYGEDFTASIEHENIWAAQFHPEKSHKAGLALIKNWCEHVTQC